MIFKLLPFVVLFGIGVRFLASFAALNAHRKWLKAQQDGRSRLRIIRVGRPLITLVTLELVSSPHHPSSTDNSAAISKSQRSRSSAVGVVNGVSAQYSTGIYRKTLDKAMKKVDYEDLDLSHLVLRT